MLLNADVKGAKERERPVNVIESGWMATTFDATAFERGTDPILRFLTRDQARALVAYRGDDLLRERIEDLARRNTEGSLTEAERSEYEGYVRANKFIAILQSKARKLLATGNGGA